MQQTHTHTHTRDKALSVRKSNLVHISHGHKGGKKQKHKKRKNSKHAQAEKAQFQLETPERGKRDVLNRGLFIPKAPAEPRLDIDPARWKLP